MWAVNYYASDGRLLAMVFHSDDEAVRWMRDNAQIVNGRPWNFITREQR